MKRYDLGDLSVTKQNKTNYLASLINMNKGIDIDNIINNMLFCNNPSTLVQTFKHDVSLLMRWL